MSDQLPDGWRIVRLGELGTLATSSVDKLTADGEQPVQLVNYMDVYSRRFIDQHMQFQVVTASKDEVVRFQVQKGDILFTPSSETPDDIGHSAVVADDLPDTVHSYHTVRLRVQADAELDLRFRGWVANNDAVRRYLAQCATGSTRYTLSLGRLGSAIVALPPLAQQRRIAEILSTVDEAIEATEKLIAKHQQIKAGLMHDLFTRGLRPDGHPRPPHTEAPHLYKDSPLGPIPKEWDIRTLGSILQLHGGCLQTGPFGSQLHADEYRPDGVPVVMPQNIDDGRIVEEGIACIWEKRARDLSRHRVRPGDIIIARRGELSRAAAISDREAGWLCGTGCFLLRLGSSDLRSGYASYIYRQDFVQRQIAGLAVGTTMPSLNNSVMSRLLFPFCEPEEQDRIVDRVTAQDGLLHAFFSELASLENLHRGLMHDLLTGRVCVGKEQDAAALGGAE